MCLAWLCSKIALRVSEAFISTHKSEVFHSNGNPFN